MFVGYVTLLMQCIHCCFAVNKFNEFLNNAIKRMRKTYLSYCLLSAKSSLSTTNQRYSDRKPVVPMQAKEIFKQEVTTTTSDGKSH